MKCDHKSIKMKRRTIYLALALAAACYTSGCNKAVVADPPVGSLLSNNIFKGDATAIAAMSSVYIRLMSNSESFAGGSKSISLLMGMAADEMQNYKQQAPYTGFYVNNIPKDDNFWSELFRMIYSCNAVLEGLKDPSSTVSEAMKATLRGEAMFMRAFLLFYGTNLYGDFPIVTSTDYRINNELHRSPQADVYKKIVSDLQEAQTLLSDDYLTPSLVTTPERLRPNKATATALLARVYLYLKDWKNAEIQATTVINNASYVMDPDLEKVFIKESQEAIWQLSPVIPEYNTNDASYFLLSLDPGVATPAAMQESLVSSFAPEDKRAAAWIGAYTSTNTSAIFHYPYKYKVNMQPAVVEYLVVFRLAEQYLIRAEARAQQQNLSGATTDLDVIRTRAGLPGTTATTQTALLDAIIEERRLELFTEWGHRWFDLKRTARLDARMAIIAPQKGGAWASTAQLLPIPLGEIFLNPNLTQNTGY